MLLRKADWHDYDGLELLLKRGVDPNRITRWGRTALHQAVMRDNSIDHINLLLDHRADATLAAEGQTTVALAARRGRGDILESLTRRGIAIELYGPDLLAAACARNDTAAVRAIAGREPLTVAALIDRGGELLAEFAGVGNTDGLRHLLDLGIPADAPYAKGDPYYGVPRNSTALQVAAWRGRHETVKLLIDRGADVNAVDANGRTPLTLAVRACVDSYWSDCRSPDSVRALLAAGASAAGVVVPCGYGAVDDLLRERRS